MPGRTKKTTNKPRTKGGSTLAGRRTIVVEDPSVARALAEELGHQAPFSNAEVATIEALRVQYARDISALASCRSLQQISIRQSEIDDLGPLADLPELSLVRADYNSLRDIAALRKLPKLYTLFMSANLVEDVSPLLGLNLRRVTLLGHPLTEHSQHVALEELRTTPTKVFGEPPLVTADVDSDWLLTCELQARGWRAVFLRERQSRRSYVVRPGLRHGPHPEEDAIPISADQLRAELVRKDVTFDQLVDRYTTAS